MNRLILMAGVMIGLFSCQQNRVSTEKILDEQLPTIGVMVFEGFLTNEVVAPLDVFTKLDEDGNKLFNVVLLAKEVKHYVSEEGLSILPDFTLDESPELAVLVVPSSFHPEEQQKDEALIAFINQYHPKTDYTMSHCAGAFLLAEAGIADGKKIVTYVSGGELLQSQYPSVKVLDDQQVSLAQDGKIFSSNGSLVSYVSSLNVLERMTSTEHRLKVEQDLLINRIGSKFIEPNGH